METGKDISTYKSIPNDHIFLRGGQKKSCEDVSTELSDHKILLATVEFNLESNS